jgi:hypothetical protein
VLSIDLRPKVQSDARHVDFDYHCTTTQSMLDALRANSLLDLSKLRTFDGRAGEYSFDEQKFEFAFIDAEHTDEAVFADFLAIGDHLRPGAVCAFHDSHLVTSGLENIHTLLTHQRRRHRMIAFAQSSVSAVFFDEAMDELPANWTAQIDPWDEFRRRSKDQVLIQAMQNRLSFNLVLKEKPVVKAD